MALMSEVPTAPRVLIVDDDPDIRNGLVEVFERAGFDASAAGDVAAMEKSLAAKGADLIILDLMMPGEDGLSATKRLSGKGRPPIIMLSALGDDADRIVGLEIGADDYLAKPCNPRELAARLRAILRRSQLSADGAAPPLLEVGPTRIDPANRNATFAGVELQLTSAEFNVLQVLVGSAGTVVNKEILSRQALGRALSAYDRSIDVHVSKIRKKLAALGGDNLIVSVRGSGYQFRTGSDT